MLSPPRDNRRTSSRPPLRARPLSPPKIPDRSPYPDEDEGVGLNQFVAQGVSKLRDAFGFRSASGGSTSSGASATVGGTAGGVAGSSGPPTKGEQGSDQRAVAEDLPRRPTILTSDTLGLGRPSEQSPFSSSRATSTRHASKAAPPLSDALPIPALPRLITPSGRNVSGLISHAPSPLRSNYQQSTLEPSTSPVSTHSGSAASHRTTSPGEDPAATRPVPSQQASSSRSSQGAASVAPRAIPSLSARFMQPSSAAPVTSIESASGRATFSAVDSPTSSPQSQTRSRHTSTGSFSGALGSKVPPFMRPRRGSNASVISSSFRANLGGSPGSAGITFPWSSDTGFTSVPGFPLSGPAGDSDNRSIRTTVSIKRNKSASKAIRKLVQGDVLSKDYWMDDDKATACYDCGRQFSTFTRKHHCRICGSIFCGRCASNLLRASRFGAEGTIRVCNLCLANLEEESDEEDLHGSGSSRAAHFHAGPTIQLDHPHTLQRSISQHHHHSPTLSGSPQFSQNLLPPSGNFDSALSSRPLTPEFHGLLPASDSNFALHSPLMEGLEDQAPLRPAPFRSMEIDDEGGPTTIQGETTSGAMAAWAGNDRHGLASPRPGLTDNSQHSFISFPTSDGDDETAGHPTFPISGRFPRTESQARFDSNAPIPSPLAGVRYQSKMAQSATMLDEMLRLDEVGRPRALSTSEPSHKISGHSLAHFRTILKETIARAGLTEADQWAATLEKLLIQVSESVQPNVKAGDDIDLRRYVKLKKVPGGKIQDSEFLDGVAITKNVAHKRMMPERELKNPRIMVLTLPLEYHRVEGQYVTLTPVMAQERDYLRGLVQRIASQRPHIVLASSPVSRLALEGLLAANIAVARSVKPTALEAVMRSTQAEDVSSMDRLALDPKLGRCTTLRLSTFDHELIPGRRKTLMRFEGCHKEFGCTLILRGGDLETLKTVKEVTDFMVYVVYHLKLEMFLWYDAFGTSPPEPPRPSPPEMPDITIRSEYLTDLDSSPPTSKTDKELSPQASSVVTAANRKRLHHERALSRRIYDALRPYHDVTLSISTSVAIPPPFPLLKMSKLDNALHLLREARYEEEARVILREEQKPTTQAKPTVGVNGSSSSLATPSFTDDGPATPVAVQDNFSPSPPESAASLVQGDLAQLRPQPVRTAPSRPLPSLDSIIHSPQDVAQVSALAQIESEHASQTQLWEWYLSKYSHSLAPQNNQGLIYLSAEGCGELSHCVAPHLKKVVYYQEDDQTLGQWINQKADSAFQSCHCGKPLVSHYELLSHGETRLQVAMERSAPSDDSKITTWTYCLLCERIYGHAYLSEQSWKLSFGKFLEASFYPNPDRQPLAGCPHDFVRSHVRYFIRGEITLRVHNESIDNFEIILPASKPYVRAETKLLLKNAEITSCFQASNVYFDSVVRKLNALDGQVVDPSKADSLRLNLATKVDEIEMERRGFLELLASSAKTSSPMDVLAINPVLTALQVIVVKWDDSLTDLEKSFFPTEKDVRRIAEGRIRRMFAGNENLGSERGGGSSIRSSTVSEVDETEGHGDTESDSNDSSAQDSEGWPGVGSILLTSLSPSQGTLEVPPTSSLLNDSLPTPQLSASLSSVEDSATPMNTGFRLTKPADQDESYFPSVIPPPLGVDVTPASDDQASANDSDSTISAVPTSLKPLSILSTSMTALSPTGEETSPTASSSAARPSASRIPRRSSRSANKVATLVHRFQQQEGDEQLGDDEDEDKELAAYRSSFKSSASPRLAGALSESEQEPETFSRVRLRRGLTEGATRKKRLSTHRTLTEQATDSKIPVPKHTSPRLDLDMLEPSSPEVTTSTLKDRKINLPRPPAGPSAPANEVDDAPSSAPSTSQAEVRNKPRIAGKAGGTPSTVAGSKRPNGGSNRVSTITRHFDRLSREAERDRQKRMSLARGRRARPVTVAKAVVTSLDLRDAVKDESDSSVSSEADDEEENQGSPLKQQAGKRPRHASPTSPIAKPLPSTGSPTIPHPLQEHDPLSTSFSAPATPPHASEAATSKKNSPRKALQDSVQLDLGPFEKVAPLSSMPPTPLMTGSSTTSALSGGGRGGHMSESELSAAGPERQSILKTLSSLWAFTDADLAPLEYPLGAGTHLFKDSRIIIREEEPMSIVAFTLDSPTYNERLRAAQASALQSSPSTKTQSLHERTETGQDWTIVGHSDAQEREESVLDGEGLHLQYVVPSGGTNFFCRVIFLERFDNLRTRCGLSGDEGFIESLARCVKWESSGGKSKSAFLKTKDDRFVAKELSRQEMDDFSRFAPAYFDYMADCLDNERPTALAKIFGVYKMGFTTSSRGSLRMNVMVMENLFYDKRFQVIYDLKGNQRGRHIEPSGKAGEVLLDANLEKTLWNHPLYLRDYSKKILRSALHNDTKFLSEQGVMDYSVVVAVDKNSGEITAGIIDYIRTFTWDKKLESWVKDSAFFPSKGVGEPTIVGPKQYKNRFRAAIERYLSVIPDFWLHHTPEGDPIVDAADSGIPHLEGKEAAL